jgi:hypothetical protein
MGHNMNAVVFTDEATADQAVQAIDDALGFPKPGTDVGPGIHASPEESVTLHYQELTKHPTDQKWALPVDALIQPKLSDPKIASIQPMDATWIVQEPDRPPPVDPPPDPVPVDPAPDPNPKPDPKPVPPDPPVKPPTKPAAGK